MKETLFDSTPLQELLAFIKELYTIRYEEEELPENVGRVFDSYEDYCSREIRNVPVWPILRWGELSQRLDDLKKVFYHEQFNNNNLFIENSLKLIQIELNESKSKGFTVPDIENKVGISEEFMKDIREDTINYLNELKEFVISLRTPIDEITTNNNANNPVDVLDEPDFDNSFGVKANSDTRKVLFLWEFDIIDHLQKMGYSNNQIGQIITDLCDIPEITSKNKSKNIGSLIDKIQKKIKGNPLNSDAGKDYIDKLKEKYKTEEKKSRKK